MNAAEFRVNDRCVGCEKCAMVCPGQVLEPGADKKPRLSDFKEFGWDGCWKCQHCLAVCPVGAVSIFGKKPENSLAPADTELNAKTLDSLIANRRSCRRYLDENADPAIIEGMLAQLANAPNGGNKQQVEFTLTDDKAQTEYFRNAVLSETERLANLGVYPAGFDEKSYNDMKRWRSRVRPDMIFCGAPHLLIPHSPTKSGGPIQDTIIAGTYFELLCASRGLGSVIMTFPLDALFNMPKIKNMLEIPESHYIGMIIGFGVPEIKYRRGTQRETEPNRIHRLTFSITANDNERAGG